MTRYLPLAVANELIIRSKGGADHLKLQKLVYMVHGLWLADNDEPCLGANPEVWTYGPVFSDLYHQLKSYRAAPIKELQTFFSAIPRVPDKDVSNVIDAAWKRFGGMSGAQLSNLTHEPGSPWHQIAKSHNFKVPAGTEIPVDLIKEYFRVAKDMATA